MAIKQRLERLEQAIGRDDEDQVIVVDWTLAGEDRPEAEGEIVICWDEVVIDEKP